MKVFVVLIQSFLVTILACALLVHLSRQLSSSTEIVDFLIILASPAFALYLSKVRRVNWYILVNLYVASICVLYVCFFYIVFLVTGDAL